MTRQILFAAVLTVISGCLSAQQENFSSGDPVTVVTWNMRYNNPDDGQNAWPNRKAAFLRILKDEKPDIFGLQEALYDQVQDVEKAFPRFKRVGVGREDGNTKGEFAVIFYDTVKFRSLSSGNFWLSQTPFVPGSMGWDAACTRIVTWTQLQRKNGGAELFVFNTHFDHIGQVARRNSAWLLLHAVDSLAGNRPAIITGDFNAQPGSEPVSILTGKNNPIHFINSSDIAGVADSPSFTYAGFKPGEIQGEIIDYIFIRNIRKVSEYSVNTCHDGDYYPSDHLPVKAKVLF